MNSQFTASDFAGKVASTVGGVTTYTYTLDEGADGTYSGINLSNLAIQPPPFDSSSISLDVSVKETSGSDIQSSAVTGAITVTGSAVSNASGVADPVDPDDINEDQYASTGMPFYDSDNGKYFRVSLSDKVGTSETVSTIKISGFENA